MKTPQKLDLDGLPPIKVVGVGGGGCNAVNRMIQDRIYGVQFVAVNTDSQALARSEAPAKIRIGEKLTRGLGGGGDPTIGQRAAEESRDELIEALKGCDMIFVTAGMGGATGSGAAPVIAEVAKQSGALTIGVVTKPFAFEGSKRRRQAEEGISRLRDKVDTLIIIPNDRLVSLYQQATAEDAFRAADDVLRQGIRGISEIITIPGEINVDFNDVRKIMSEAGPALMAIGYGSGEHRAVEAARQAIQSPLLDVSINGARGVLYNVTGPRDLGLHELTLAGEVIAEVVDPDAEIIFGMVVDDTMDDEVKITVIATGFGAMDRSEALPADEKIRSLKVDSLSSLSDTELPTFLRRSVTSRGPIPQGPGSSERPREAVTSVREPMQRCAQRYIACERQRLPLGQHVFLPSRHRVHRAAHRRHDRAPASARRTPDSRPAYGGRGGAGAGAGKLVGRRPALVSAGDTAAAA